MKTFIRFFVVFAFATICLSFETSAQQRQNREDRQNQEEEDATGETRRIALWKCVLPGGTYEVAVRSIISVSTHEYVVDGAARVTEVNIDTGGNLSARFYYIEPNTPQTAVPGIANVLEEAKNQLSNAVETASGEEGVWKKVVKSYPITTHAKTVEYRLESRDELDKLFKSAEEAFRLSRNGTFKSE